MIKRILILTGAVIGVVLLAYLAFLLWNQYTAPPKSPATSKYKIEHPGKVYLSLVPGSGSAPSGIYTYTLASGSLHRVLAEINRMLPSYYINSSPTPSNDGTLITFVRRKNSELIPQIYTALPDGTVIKQITASPEPLKRAPVLSPDKKHITFEASSDGSISSAEIGGTPDDWGVYLADMSGNTFYVTAGTNPLFSPDGTKLLVLKNDGFHLLDIRNPRKAKDAGLVLHVIGSDVYHWTRASLSHDGTRIVWAVPSTKQIFVAKILSWNAFSVVPEKTIDIAAYQAVFSPDDNQLALEEIRPSPGRTDSHIVISIYDLASGQLSDAINLTKYMNTYIRLGGWIK